MNQNKKTLDEIYSDSVGTHASVGGLTGKERHEVHCQGLEAVRAYVLSSESAWISVEKQLPKETEEVLFMDGTGWIVAGHLRNTKWYQGTSGPRHEWEVTHWQPLPQPPARKEE